MESSAALRPFHYSAGTASQAKCLMERLSIIHLNGSIWSIPSRPYTQCLLVGGNFNSSTIKRNVTRICCSKSLEATAAAKSGVPSDTTASTEKKPSRKATFPKGFEALMLEVCDETEIAEVKMKIGDFEMHMKRNIGATKAPLSTISPMTAPPIPTEPMTKSAPTSPPPSPPKSSTEKITPFTNVSFGKSSKLAALEASGSSNYVLVTSPTVGTFRRSRTVKGKKQPLSFKEGDLIKEGQVIGYLDQFGTELPVKSDVAGEVLKLLFDDGEAVGYGDPLIAVLPSFHGINNVS